VDGWPLGTKSEGVGLIIGAISFQDFQPMWSWSTNVTDRQTDGQTNGQTDDMQSQYRALHYSASRGNKLLFLMYAVADVTKLSNSDYHLPIHT